jgi:hypothetical protein
MLINVSHTFFVSEKEAALSGLERFWPIKLFNKVCMLLGEEEESVSEDRLFVISELASADTSFLGSSCLIFLSLIISISS